MVRKIGRKTVINLTEKVIIRSEDKEKKYLARIDTGATRSSIHSKIVKDMKLGPVIKTKLVKSASGSRKRPVIKVRVELAKRKFNSQFTVADRSHMKYKILIGQNMLKKGFLIDPSKK